MNEANKNEVDLLLRSFARGQGEGGSASAHLDADELNSYAEGLVPAAARVRYTEHLADCPSCRGIVVGLTQAAGAVIHREAASESSKSSFWRSLSLFFSSPALRYAVPALVLTVIIGLGLIAFRQQRTSDFVAQNQPANAAASPQDETRPNAVIAPSPVESPTTFGAPARPNVEVGEVSKNKTADKKADAELPVPSEPTLAKAGRDDAAAPGSGVGMVAQSPPAAPAKAAELPPSSVEVRKLPDFAREPAERREEQERVASREEYKNKDDEDIHGPNRARNAPLSATQRAADNMIRGGPSANKNNTNEVETRTVSGKRFTRGSAGWVDTEYNSQSMTRLTRGSDQYRALVADEPGIRTIAERLDGVVIVVWKGRAYRIQ